MNYDATLYTAWLPEIIPHCADVIDIVAINAVRNAAIEFLDTSQWLQATLPAVSGQANLASYAITLPDETDLVAVQAAFYDNVPLLPKSEDQLRSLYLQDWRNVAGSPRFYMRSPDDNASILLCPAPIITEAAALSVVAILRPTRASTGIDTSVYNNWLEPIASGAIYRLMMTPGQSYSNQRLAVGHRAMFRGGIDDAKIDRNTGQERARLVARPPRLI